MNKAKAYRRLKKKQKHSVHSWSELSQTQDRLIRLPLRDLKQISIEELQLAYSSEVDSTMFGIRSLNTLKSVIEVEDLEGQSRPDLSQSNTSLPQIDSSQQYSGNRHISRIPARIDSRRRPGTTANDGYTVLQAKLDALILPNPQKRKASRSFSGSSSGFHGRKNVSNLRNINPVMKQGVPNKSVDKSTSKEALVQFPIASKMRQLLTIEQTDQPPPAPQTEFPGNSISTPHDVEKKVRMREFTKTAQFYFPSYTSQKEKALKINTSTDSPETAAKITNDPTFMATGKRYSTGYHTPKPKSHLPKQVSFCDENTNLVLSKRLQQSSNIQLPPAHSLPLEHTSISNGLALTIKNLDMYNTLSRNSELSVPSDDDSRTTCWIKERQHWNTEHYDAIPEIDENISSTSHEGDSSPSSTLGKNSQTV